MSSEGFFYQAFVYLSAAVISVPIAKRLGLGSVLGYLLAGIIIGPFALGFIGHEGEDLMHFAEFGVVMMLFLIGLELQPRLLWKMRGPILGLGGLQVAVTSGTLMAIGMLFGFEWRISLAIGMILSLSSTAIVLQTLNEKGLMKTDGGQNSFSILLFQDIAFIPMLAILPLLASSKNVGAITETVTHSSNWVDGFPGWAQTLIVLSTMVVIIVAGRFLISPIFRFIAKTKLREIFTAAALLLVIGIAILMTKVGLSPALGTFLAGVVLATSEYRHELEGDIEPFKGLLLGLFFIAVGASIDFGLIIDQPLLILKMVAALIVIKFVLLFVLGRLFKMHLDNNLLLAFALAQSGEFGFVLFSFATQNGVIGTEIVNPLMAVVAISMALTPLLMLLNEKLIQPRVGTKEKSRREADSIDEENPVIIAGFGRFGNITCRLLRANGINSTVLDLDADNVELLRKLGFKVFYGDASRHDLLHSAGADKAKLIILAIDESDKTIEMVHTIRKHFPHLKILARANGSSDAYELLENGVEFVFRETFDTSLQVGIEALKLLGYRSFHAHRSSKLFKKTDEQDLRTLAKLRHDRKIYINTARQRIHDLEETLINQLNGHEDERDAGWDTAGLREEFGDSTGSD
jgi:monovalent cation:proton antiporter-2 (CPA2) family protein